MPACKDEVFAASLAGILIAALDEFHQLFVPGRGGTPQDVLLDYSGMVTGYFVCLGVIHIALKLCEKEITVGEHDSSTVFFLSVKNYSS